MFRHRDCEGARPTSFLLLGAWRIESKLWSCMGLDKLREPNSHLWGVVFSDFAAKASSIRRDTLQPSFNPQIQAFVQRMWLILFLLI